MMNEVVLFDIIGVVGFSAALLFTLRAGQHQIDNSSKCFLGMSLGIYCFIGTSNILEHSQLTDFFDYYEDRAEIFYIPLFLFFIYSIQSWFDTRKRMGAEQFRRESEQKYCLIIENQRDLIVKLDAKWRFLYASPSFCELFNTNEEQLLGRIFQPKIHMEDERAAAEARKSLFTPPHIAEHQERIYTNDGWRWYAWSSKATMENGTVHFIVSVGRDITKIKLTEEKLRHQEEQVKLLLNSTAEAIFGLDIKGNCTFCNPSCLRMLGYADEDEIIGKNMHALIHHTRADGSPFPVEDCRVLNSFGTKQGFYSEQDILWRADGSSVQVEYWSYPMIKEDEVVGAVVTFLDITERQTARQEKEKLEKQLRQSQKMEAIGTLAGGIAHDFNNILGSILGYGQMAKEQLPPESRVGKDVSKMLIAANRAADLVKQILTFSRQEEVELQPVLVQVVIKEALKMLRSSLPTTIEIRGNIDGYCKPVMADPCQIHQVLMNLCTNAKHAMRSHGGVLTVSLIRLELPEAERDNPPGLSAGPHLKLTVSDTGHGMDQVTKMSIFDPFFTTKKRGEGTGLGLAVVHGIVESCRGAITVSSEVNQGTTFDIYFPEVTAVVIEQYEAGKEILGGNENIMIVDDDAELLEITQRMLVSLGYNAYAHTNALKALDEFKMEPGAHDLVITDMTMPKMTGAELAAEIYAVRSDMPIIMCTGFSEVINEQQARALGIRAYLMKPIIKIQLAQTVRKVLENG